MEFPDLSALPAWAQVIAYGSFGIGLAIIFGAARYGINLGKREAVTPSERGKSEVAAIIIDSTAINRLSAAAEALNETLLSMSIVGRSMARNSAAQTRALSVTSTNIDSLSEGIDKLRDEVIRAAASRE